jgi:hypothetical protein
LNNTEDASLGYLGLYVAATLDGYRFDSSDPKCHAENYTPKVHWIIVGRDFLVRSCLEY